MFLKIPRYKEKIKRKERSDTWNKKKLLYYYFMHIHKIGI